MKEELNRTNHSEAELPGLHFLIPNHLNAPSTLATSAPSGLPGVL